MTQTIQVRRGTAGQWSSVNPVLAQGEPGFETDTGKLKLGDGVTAWSALAYFGADRSGSLAVVPFPGDASTARPSATMVVWEAFPTEPVHLVEGDLWLAPGGD